MRTTFYVAAALAALNHLANAFSVPANSHSELQSFSTELSQIDSDLAVISDSELDRQLRARQSHRQT